MNLKRDLSNRSANLEAFSDAGIHLGDLKGINFDWPRLELFAQRVLKALYFVEYGVPLNNKFNIELHLSWLQKNSETINSSEKELLQVLARSKPTTVGNNTFQYWHSKVEEDSAHSVWYISLAEEFGFWGFIFPVNVLTNN